MDEVKILTRDDFRVLLERAIVSQLSDLVEVILCHYKILFDSNESERFFELAIRYSNLKIVKLLVENGFAHHHKMKSVIKLYNDDRIEISIPIRAYINEFNKNA